jgi:hypothetical protein
VPVSAREARAKAAMTRIITEPEDKPYGLRQYAAEDRKGQRWIFARRVRDVLPEEWGGKQVDGQPPAQAEPVRVAWADSGRHPRRGGLAPASSVQPRIGTSPTLSETG